MMAMEGLCLLVFAFGTDKLLRRNLHSFATSLAVKILSGPFDAEWRFAYSRA